MQSKQFAAAAAAGEKPFTFGPSVAMSTLGRRCRRRFCVGVRLAAGQIFRAALCVVGANLQLWAAARLPVRRIVYHNGAPVRNSLRLSCRCRRRF